MTEYGPGFRRSIVTMVSSRFEPITAETITDEQILQLQDETVELFGRFPPYTTIALAKPTGRDRRVAYKRERDARRYQDARVSCAALWNARHGAK